MRIIDVEIFAATTEVGFSRFIAWLSVAFRDGNGIDSPVKNRVGFFESSPAFSKDRFEFKIRM